VGVGGGGAEDLGDVGLDAVNRPFLIWRFAAQASKSSVVGGMAPARNL